MSQIHSLDLLGHVHDHLRPLDTSKAIVMGVDETVECRIFGYDDVHHQDPAGVTEEVKAVSDYLHLTELKPQPRTTEEMRASIQDVDDVHILHTAGHGQHDPVSGLSSNMRLASGQAWTVKDVFSLLCAPIMIFSSFCQSVLGLSNRWR